ncbi:ACT domain-containing protein [Pygmaiobacter massiliensis]
MTVTVGISNIDHLGSVITKLKKIKDVVAVNRL